MTTDVTWKPIGGELWRLEYASYLEYVNHQRTKLDRMKIGELEAYEARYLPFLTSRLIADGFTRGTTVLCLGARGGAEVRAFLSIGCVAVGIDLNPGPGNQYVLRGDFHNLQYGDRTIAVVFTNALDHCFDLDRVLMNVRRVLVSGGQFIVEAVRGTREGCALGPYESFAWDTIDGLIHAIEQRGFACERRESFSIPWPGQHLVFRQAATP